MISGPWARYFFYRTQSLKTTWTLRVACVGVLALLLLVTRGIWIPAVGHSLVCTESTHAVDAILIENFDVDYIPFERAGQLQAAGVASRIFVPIAVRADNNQPTSVNQGIVELMTRIAHLQNWRTIPVHETEPYSLRVAEQVREFLSKERIHSVAVVTPGLRSMRSSLIYNAVLGLAGVSVTCVPTEPAIAETWTHTWHGIQEVALQFAKLQYYRFYVLPRYVWWR